MLVQIAVTIEGREVRTLTVDVPVSPQDLEEGTHWLMQQVAQIVLEYGLEPAALEARQPSAAPDSA